MKAIDAFLNKITMYKLVLYYLTGLLIVAMGLSFLGYLPYEPHWILLSSGFLIMVSLIVNNIFGAAFDAVTNVESVYISALILALIIDPARTPGDYMFLMWAAILTMASKYILAINNKHIFNPVALAVALTAAVLNQSATWWVGTGYMLPFVLLGGFLVVRKIRRFDLVYYFLLVSFAAILSISFAKGTNVFSAAQHAVLYSPIFFFAFVMLTEPLTTPPTKHLQAIYGGLVGLFFAPQFHIGNYFFTPETALLAGNVFSYLVSPKQKLILKLKEKIRWGNDIFDFVFSSNQRLAYLPGQYMEWTLPGEQSDSRGNRRYLTLASSPTEKDIHIGVKFYNPSSTFKKKLNSLKVTQAIVAGQLAGDFTLPKNEDTKLAFIAGGIGITPFRSMIRYLVDKRQPRDIVLLYSNKIESEIAYKDVFDLAQVKIGLKVFYTLTDTNKVSPLWNGSVGMIDEKMIAGKIPDFLDRTFYISGPQAMVTAFKDMLQQMGLPANRIVTDYFPGFA